MTTLTWRELFNPRRELLLLCTAALELCWTFGAFQLLWSARAGGQQALSIFPFALLLALALLGTRFILSSVLERRQQQFAIIALALISILLVVRSTVFSSSPLLDFTWLAAVPAAIARFFIALSPESLVIVMGIFIWWRGIALSQTALDFETVGFRFRFGVLMLALLALVNTWVARVDLGGLVFAYFFFGLLAVALARQEDIGRSQSQVSLPLKGPWLGILGGSALLVLAMGALLSTLLTPKGVRTFFDLLHPLEPIVVVLLYLVLIVVSFVVEIVYNLLFTLMQRLMSGNPNAQPFQLPQRPALPEQQQPPDLSSLMMYFDPVRMLCSIALFALVLMGLAYSMNRLKGPSHTDDNEVRESVPISLDLDPFRRLRNLFRRRRVELDEGGIASIRRIYANLTRLAAQRGFPRREAETPYEFIRELRSALPAVEMEERAITEAYVRVHYGEHVPGAYEIQQVRNAWDRIKSENERKKG